MPKAGTVAKNVVAKPPAKTAEQRAADRKAKKLREEQERLAAEALEQKRRDEFMAKLPMKMLELMARSTKYDGVRYHVEGGTETSLLRVMFEFDEVSDSSMDMRLYDDSVLVYMQSWNYDSERHVATIEDLMDQRDKYVAEVQRLRGVAMEAYNALTEEQRKALGVRKPF